MYSGRVISYIYRFGRKVKRDIRLLMSLCVSLIVLVGCIIGYG